MFRKTAILMLIIPALLVIASCSNGGDNMPMLPDDQGAQREYTGGTACLGLWQVVADRSSGTFEIVDMRAGDMIINVLSFLEPPPLSGMSINFSTLDIDFPNGTASVDVILTHPIPDPVFMGFDVRGVVFGPELLNADGYTPVMAPKYFNGEPFGYMDGLLGVPDYIAGYDMDIYGYKYFCKNLDLYDDLAAFYTDQANLAMRGVFPDGMKLSRHYELDWNGTGYDVLVFNYAIYANYDWPVGTPPIEIADFDIEKANSAEAFCINVTETSNTLYYVDGLGSGGSISLEVGVWDWQGDISGVTIESREPGIISETAYDAYLGPAGHDYCYLYEFHDVPGYPTASGELDIVVTAVDAKTFGECWFMDLLSPSNAMHNEKIYSCQVYRAIVSDHPPCIWNPYVGLNTSYGSKCRAADETVIPDANSTYDSSSQFDVTGSNADGEGAITYQYYVSTSGATCTGSPVGWVEFPFDGGGSFTVSWVDYDAIAPDFVHIWVRAWDGVSGSSPVLCDDTIALSEVHSQSNTFSEADGWYVQTTADDNIEVGDEIHFFNNYLGYSDAYVYHSAISWPTSKVTMEFYIPTDWMQYTGSYAKPGFGPNQSLGVYFATITTATSGQILNYSTTDYLGDNRLFGFYFYDGSLFWFWDFHFYIDDVAIYDDPV